MMYLLNGRTMGVKDTFLPESKSITLNLEGISTESFTVGPEAPEISVGDWIKDTTPNRITIVWRVKSIDTDAVTQTRTVQLEHTIAELKDGILFGEHTTGMVAGVTGATTVTPAAAIRYILQNQSVWQLGTCDYNTPLPYDFNNVTLYAGLEAVSSGLLDYYWEYDFSSLPFTLNVKQKTDTLGCEMRMSRNLSTMKKTVDRSQMYTRFYPVGNGNIHIGDANNGYDWVSKNESLYGIIAHQETDNTINSKELLKAWALEKLERHCQPVVTITISGLELSQATGESMDRIVPGLICRVPVGGDVIKERVTKITWSDAIHEPERVTVTLANALRDVASIVSQLKKSGGGGAGAAAKDKEKDHAWIVDNKEKVELVACAVAGKDDEGQPDWDRVATLTVDGNGIDERVRVTEGDLVTHWAAIENNGLSIAQEVEDRSNAVDSLSGAVIHRTTRFQSADDIIDMAYDYTDALQDTIEGSAIWQDKDNIVNVAGQFQVTTDQTTGKKTVKVISGGGLTVQRDGTEFGVYDSGSLTAGVIVNKINGGTTKILGKNVIIDGDTQINGQAVAQSLSAAAIVTSGLVHGGVMLSDTTVTGLAGVFTQNLSVNGRQVNIVDASVNTATNTLTLTKADGTTINFRKAGSTPTLTGTWSSGVLTVTSSPEPVNNLYYYLGHGNVSWNGTNGTIPITSAGSQGQQGTTVYNCPVSGTVPYNAGKDSIGIEGSWSGRVFTASLTGKTGSVNGGTISANAAISYDSATHKYTATGTAYTSDSRVSGYLHQATATGGTEAYDAGVSSGKSTGWSLAVGKVSAPSTGTGTTFSVSVPDTTYNTSRNMSFSIAKGATPGSSGYASVSISGTVVGRISIGDWYDAGYSAGYAAGVDAGKAAMGLSRSGNVITVAESTTKKITVNYRASSHTAGSISWTSNSQSRAAGVLRSGNMVYYSSSSTIRNYTASISGDSYTASSLSYTTSTTI